MAVCIGCAGTGLLEDCRLCQISSTDALAMVFIQITEAQEPKVATIKKLYIKMSETRRRNLIQSGSYLGKVLLMLVAETLQFP